VPEKTERDQWWRRIRRGYDIPSVVPDDVARQAILQHLVRMMRAQALPDIGYQETGEAILTAVSDLCIEGDLWEVMLPDDLLSFGEPQTVEQRVLIRAQKATDHPEHSESLELVVQEVLDRLVVGVKEEQTGLV